jgi:hypothetical protein
MAEGDTWLNALIGAVVGLVVGSVIPFGTVVGGAVAGYLQGGDRTTGIRVGALAGLLALVPFLAGAFLVGNLLLGIFVGGFGVPRAASGLGALFVFVGLVFAVVYTVGASAVGGWLGNYVRYDTDIEL